MEKWMTRWKVFCLIGLLFDSGLSYGSCRVLVVGVGATLSPKP